MRSGSGVTPITVFSKPAKCGGACLFCPDVPGLPKSYLPRSRLESINLDYSPFAQIKHWLEKLFARRAVASKLEVIVLGGSFTNHPISYQKEFLSGIYHAIEGFSEMVYDIDEIIKIHQTSKSPRIIGITIETRPDLVRRDDISQLFMWGVTKVELGIQSTDELVLKLNNRTQTKQTILDAVHALKTSGLKVGFHLLFGMPHSNILSDKNTVLTIFRDPRLLPDHLKIYFCESFKGKYIADAFNLLKERSEWRPLNIDEREEIARFVFSHCPTFVRISRVGRKFSRDDVDIFIDPINRAKLENESRCECIRCREPKKDAVFSSISIKSICLGDNEHYFEATTQDNLCLGLMRIRYENKEAIIRELHVYGKEIRLDQYTTAQQHRKIGKCLLHTAETVFCKANKVRVAAGIGVRAYYISLGYELDAHGYMMKKEASLPTPKTDPSQHLKGVVDVRLRIAGREAL